MELVRLFSCHSGLFSWSLEGFVHAGLKESSLRAWRFQVSVGGFTRYKSGRGPMLQYLGLQVLPASDRVYPGMQIACRCFLRFHHQVSPSAQQRGLVSVGGYACMS